MTLALHLCSLLVADQVLNYVEECLPSVRLFQKRSCSKLCGLSWNVLKCVAGLSSGTAISTCVHLFHLKTQLFCRFLAILRFSREARWPYSYCTRLWIESSRFEPWPGIFVVFLCKTLYSNSAASLHQAPVSSQVCKQVLVNSMPWGSPVIDFYPIQGE